MNNDILRKYARWLSSKNLSLNTINSYLCVARQFLDKYGELNQTNVASYKTWLLETRSIATTNQRIIAMNHLLKCLSMDGYTLCAVKSQRKILMDDIISMDEYIHLKTKLLQDDEMEWYCLVWLLATTGLRISEALALKRSQLDVNPINVLGKGGKCRPVFIPNEVNNAIHHWLAKSNNESDYIFVGRKQLPLTTRGVEWKLKVFAIRYGINPKILHPHSFRHFFAKEFLKRCGDLTLLANLLGHSSLETTRIYLLPTAQEVRNKVNAVITW